MPKRRALPKPLPPGRDLEPREGVELPEWFAGLPEPERSALHDLIRDKFATVWLSALAGKHGVEAIERLEALGLTERWALPNGTRVCLTPLGAGGLILAEHPVRVTVTEHDPETGCLVEKRVTSDEPYWLTEGTPWGPCCGRNRRGVIQAPDRTGRGFMLSLGRPELIVDRRPGPEWMIDSEAERILRLFAEGRKPSEADEAAILSVRSEWRDDLAGGLGSVSGDPAPELAGVPVRIDRRLRRGMLSPARPKAKGRKRGPKRRAVG